MDEHEDGLDWPPAVTTFFISLFSYTKLSCSLLTNFLLLLEVTV